MDGDRVNQASTLAIRAALKADRLKEASPAAAPQKGQAEPVGQPIGGSLQFGRLNAKRWFACACGQALAQDSGNWRDGAACRKVEPAQINTGIVLHVELEMRQYLCSSCGSSLSVDVLQKGAPHPHDIRLHVDQ